MLEACGRNFIRVKGTEQCEGNALSRVLFHFEQKDLSSHRDHVNTIISVCLASLANPPRNCVNEEVSVERGSRRLLSLCRRRSQKNFLRNVFCHNLECCRASHRKCWTKKALYGLHQMIFSSSYDVGCQTTPEMMKITLFMKSFFVLASFIARRLPRAKRSRRWRPSLAPAVL